MYKRGGLINVRLSLTEAFESAASTAIPNLLYTIRTSLSIEIMDYL